MKMHALIVSILLALSERVVRARQLNSDRFDLDKLFNDSNPYLKQGLSKVQQLSDTTAQPPKFQMQDPLYSSLVAEQWSWTLPLSALQSSFLYPGYTARLKLVLLKLLSGETVKIGALGGSVTEGYMKNKAHQNWFTLVTRWLQRAFPEATVISKNGGVGATNTVFMENCYGERLEADVDLVFYEYAVNIKYRPTLHHEEVASYERLMRLLLSGEHGAGAVNTAPKPPAVMMFNHWSCCITNLSDTQTQFLPYDKQQEDQFNVLAQYYGMPAVSVRDALFHPVMRKEGVLKHLDESFPKDMYGSRIHPNAYGSRFLADLLVYAFYQVLDQLRHYGITRGDMELMRAPMPPPLSASRGRRIVVACWFQNRLTPIVVTSETSASWRFGVEAHEKSGYITLHAGDHIRVRVDTRVPQMVANLQPEQDENNAAKSYMRPEPVVQIGLLYSYVHMGEVKITCVAGCSCEPQVINTHQPNQRHSQTYFNPLAVTEAERCDIQLEALEATTSGEHKIKLNAIAVTMRVPG